jgi:hypothetical protein
VRFAQVKRKGRAHKASGLARSEGKGRRGEGGVACRKAPIVRVVYAYFCVSSNVTYVRKAPANQNAGRDKIFNEINIIDSSVCAPEFYSEANDKWPKYSISMIVKMVVAAILEKVAAHFRFCILFEYSMFLLVCIPNFIIIG